MYKLGWLYNCCHCERSEAIYYGGVRFATLAMTVIIIIKSAIVYREQYIQHFPNVIKLSTRLSMNLPRIYQACSLSPNSEIQLEQKVAHHLIHVLRLSIGNQFIIFNGEGGEYLAEIQSISKKTVTVHINKFIEKDIESSLKIHLAQGIPRGEKMDFILQKAVELGIDEFTPLFTQRCNVKLASERIEKRMQHWQGVIIAACEQSGRTYIPRLNTPTPYQQWLATCSFGFVLHPHAHSKLSQLTRPNGKIAIVIGPEGGLSEDEVAQAEKKGFHRLCLGPRILRTETAPLAAITALQCFWGDMG